MIPRVARRLAVMSLAVWAPCQAIAGVYAIESGYFALGAALLSLLGILASVALWLVTRTS